MKLKPGYKQTEVGEIPVEWVVKRIGDLGRIVRGGSPRPAGDPRYFNGSFIPWLTVAALTNISESQLRVSATVGYLTEEGAKHSRTLDEGTLIIANSGATLGVAKLLEVKCCANDGIAAIINQKSGDKEFVCHYINSRTTHLRDVVATGNGQPNLNTTLIRDLSLPFPPENEQRAIAAALSDVDALIASLDELIAKKRDIKQAAMQQLLTPPAPGQAGHVRPLGFGGEWEVKPIGSFSAFVTKGATPTTYGFNWEGDGVLFLRSECVSDDGLDLAQSMFISEAAHAALIRGEVRSGDILMTITGNVGRVIHLKSDFGFANINQHIARIRVKDPSVLSDFVFHWLSRPSVRAYYTSITTGQAYPQISLKQVRETQILLPPIEEQTAIASVLSEYGRGACGVGAAPRQDPRHQTRDDAGTTHREDSPDMRESQHVEWKESWRDEYLRWILGFANAEGGVLVIGRNKSGVVTGVKDAAKLMEDIPNKVRDILGIMVEVNLREEAGGNYLEIAVEPYPNPVSYKGEYCYRSGSTNQTLKGAALDRFLLRRQGRHWDSVPVPFVAIKCNGPRFFLLMFSRYFGAHFSDSLSVLVADAGWICAPAG